MDIFLTCEHTEEPDNIQCEYCNAYDNCQLRLRHVYKLIKGELDHQHKEWGSERILLVHVWLRIIGEEFNEFAEAAIQQDKQATIDELVDVAASAIAAIRSLMLEQPPTTDPQAPTSEQGAG